MAVSHERNEGLGRKRGCDVNEPLEERQVLAGKAGLDGLGKLFAERANMGFRTDALSVSLWITRNASRKNERSSVCLEIKRKGGGGERRVE
jgi:hypothetical protein